MDPSLLNLAPLLVLLGVPTLILLLCRFLNRRWDQQADMQDRCEAVSKSAPMGG